MVSLPPIACSFHETHRTLRRYLDAHVMGGYKFIMQNYEAGYKICIFGKQDSSVLLSLLTKHLSPSQGSPEAHTRQGRLRVC